MNPTLEWTPTLTTQDKNNHSVMSEKWHYIKIEKNCTEELYNLEKDPMEWTNLANQNTPEINAVKTYLRSFMPTENADNVASKMRDKSPTGENVTNNEPDLTIKPKRVLSQLK